MTYNASIARLDIPARIKALPVSPSGYPIPHFVCKDPLDFRVADQKVWMDCVRKKQCWVCGQPLGRTFAFVAGPMCAINATVSEPPSHRECAEWSAVACPFLTKPKMRRNETPVAMETTNAAGFGLKRNPGVALVWVTRAYRPFKVEQGTAGYLIQMGDPSELLWFCEGRAATRDEVKASIESGFPSLLEMCLLEPTEERRLAARRDLARRTQWVIGKLPGAADALEDAALNKLCDARAAEPKVAVSVDDL